MAAHHWPARLGELSRCSRRDLGQTTLTKGFVGMQRIFSNGRQQSLLLSGCGCMQSVASASSHRLHATRRLKQEFFLGRSNIPFGARLFFWWLLALWREDWLFFRSRASLLIRSLSSEKMASAAASRDPLRRL